MATEISGEDWYGEELGSDVRYAGARFVEVDLTEVEDRRLGE